MHGLEEFSILPQPQDRQHFCLTLSSLILSEVLLWSESRISNRNIQLSKLLEEDEAEYCMFKILHPSPKRKYQVNCKSQIGS